MTELVTKDEAYFDLFDKILDLHLQGDNPRQISKTLAVPQKRVTEILNEWKSSDRVSEELQHRVKELLVQLDAQYTTLIKKSYEVIADVDARPSPSATFLTVKNQAIKAIADLEDKRVGALQRSGLLENDDIISELAEMERQKEAIQDILEHNLCDKCRPVVLRKFGEAIDKPKPLVIFDE